MTENRAETLAGDCLGDLFAALDRPPTSEPSQLPISKHLPRTII